ncbi:GGDEF domain-containing protein [Kushneria marisflavi]|uniref:diguanylate cyclase n=1 Tax=Kushneria marisflavi TaxID=157779 RepID=A0A240UMB8_9GAMM|nr:GGDEF domain-containing protein [Kushneria marisflavi]ART62265.1 hypothetical protein B9H00_03580 [Kushneria marisflavi]RKD87362.1 diguanylate cyclase (GGDEF)-like protein [Kushneria marisflavi]
MLETIKKFWSPGIAGNPHGVCRRIALSNQLGIFGTVATIPYQLFYYFYDFAGYRGVFLANLMFMAGYLSVLPLNYKRWYNTASTALLINGCCQLFVVTCFIGTGAGVNLFYFSLAAILAFLYKRPGIRVYTAIMASFGVLYLITHFLFTADTVISPMPSPWIDVMYGFSVAGALTLSGVVLYIFRQQIDHAEGELMLSNRYLEALSNTDPLTGLANRRMLDAALEREWSRLVRHQEALSVLMFDVDHFKHFNDRYGHAEGDRCLQRVALAARKVISRSSDLLVRYGGEEFVIVLPDTDEAGAKHLGDQLRAAIERLKVPHEALGKEAFVTISVGVSSIEYMMPGIHACSGMTLLKRADEAMYQAKLNGRNQMVYHPFHMPQPQGH